MGIKFVIPLPGPVVYSRKKRPASADSGSGVGLLFGATVFLSLVFVAGVILATVMLVVTCALLGRVLSLRLRAWRRSRMR